MSKAENLILGIDPGLDGALAVLTPGGELVSVHDMPTLTDGPSGRRTVNAGLLAALIYETHATAAYVELVGPRPKEGPVGAFGFGRSRGVIEGACAACGVSLSMITPPVWKRLHAIPPGSDKKDLARALVIQRWPGKADLFALKRHDGRAESALIGLAGIWRSQRNAA